MKLSYLFFFSVLQSIDHNVLIVYTLNKMQQTKLFAYSDYQKKNQKRMENINQLRFTKYRNKNKPNTLNTNQKKKIDEKNCKMQ